MAIISKTVACLRVTGDDLIPDDITRQLGAEPTRKMIKGKPFFWSNNSKPSIARSGMWRLEATVREPGDLDYQVSEILDVLTSDIAIWQSLANKYRIDMFCGVFMEASMEGIGLTAGTMLALGQRGIEIDFDIYGPDE